MTREETAECIKVMQAFTNGEIIEEKRFSFDTTEWVESIDPSWQWYKFDYRIKPRHKYRPFKNAEECWKEMFKHQPFGWVKEKCDEPSYELLANVSENDEAPISFAVHGSVGMGIIDRPSIEFNEMFNAFTFADGTPFGIREC